MEELPGWEDVPQLLGCFCVLVTLPSPSLGLEHTQPSSAKFKKVFSVPLQMSQLFCAFLSLLSFAALLESAQWKLQENGKEIFT